MMDYYARESTMNGDIPVVEKELSIRDVIEETEKTLLETTCTLEDVARSIGANTDGDNSATEKPESMFEEMRRVAAIAHACMKKARAIQQKLY